MQHPRERHGGPLAGSRRGRGERCARREVRRRPGETGAVCACEIVAVHGSHEQTVAFARGTVVKTRRAEADS